MMIRPAFTRFGTAAAYAILAVLVWHASANAAVLSAAALGCKKPDDALKAANFRAKKDMAGFAAFRQPLAASRSCIDFAKGVTISIDEKKLPLSCVRLTGDLECYWVPDALVDIDPGTGGGGKGGGGRRR